MPPINRVAFRNVHFYNASTGEPIGGFYQGGSLNEETLIWALTTVILIIEGPLTVRYRESGRTITPSSNPVALGNYDIYSEGSIQLNNEAWFARLLSHSVSGRESEFRNEVRARDRKCVISGQVVDGVPWDDWVGFEAAHVFPLQKEDLWIEFNYGRWITNVDSESGRINSVQNGLLLRSDLHKRFDQYLISINPDDGYKIIVFAPNSLGVDGRILDPVCRNQDSPDRVSDELLRWHFRQCVLGNMRGAGEPIFESDFPSGTDMMATLRTEPYGKERFEMLLEAHLRNGRV